jgi:hypothetical protein
MTNKAERALIREADYESGDQEFESLRARHKIPVNKRRLDRPASLKKTADFHLYRWHTQGLRYNRAAGARGRAGNLGCPARAAGHWVQQEQPGRVSELMIEFLRQQTEQLSRVVAAVTDSLPGYFASALEGLGIAWGCGRQPAKRPSALCGMTARPASRSAKS